MEKGSINIFGVKVSILDYHSFLEVIDNALNTNSKITIAYANAHTLNQCYENKELAELLNSFDYVHPDGIGVYIASVMLYGRKGLKQRITGSDFYPMLADHCASEGRSIYFFGHSDENLERIRKNSGSLRIAGLSPGYDFNDEEIISSVNHSGADLLVIGLSFPKQELWLRRNRDKLQVPVALAVGDGIRVFSGEKTRGPKFLRDAGLEWLVRLLLNPIANFRRYAVGNPRFMMRLLSKRKEEI